MSDTASFLLRRRLEVIWALFAAVNLLGMLRLAGGDGGTIPFHFIWVSLTIIYGFTVWSVRSTGVVLTVVVAATTAAVLLEVGTGPTRPDELAEVPLMAMMFVAMVWHARRRASAEQRVVEVRERELEFIRDASHHLKTPAAVARGYAELIRGQVATADDVTDADKLIDELDHLTKIVDNLLTLMDSDGKREVRRQPIDLGEFALGLAERWNRAVDRRVVVHADEQARVAGDRERLMLALDALLENAVEATDPGDRIWIRVSRDVGRIRIRVLDNGRGFSESAARNMFERFWSERRHGSRRGTGLGLAIARSIVDAHGGTIDGSHRDGATVFTIELPIAEADEPAVYDASEMAAPRLKLTS
jgi:signal transduction histidine kinase